MDDVIIIFFLLPLISDASQQSTPPPIQQLATPPLPKPSPPTIQTIAPQTQIKPYPSPSPPQQSPKPVLSPPYPPQEPSLPIQTQPPATRTEERQERMKNILEALIGSGDFANWGNLLTTADPSLLPFTSTLFVPNNDVVLSSFPSSSSTGVNAGIDPFLFLYHIVPHRLTFNDLCLFTSPNTRLPTLLPTKSILVTNVSRANFSINGARVTDPDLYSTDSVVVHGIGGILDYQVYGGDGTVASLPWMNQSQNQDLAPMKGVGGVVVQSSKGRNLRTGFMALLSLSLGLTMI